MTHIAGQNAAKVIAALPNQRSPSPTVTATCRQANASPRTRWLTSDQVPINAMNGIKKREGLLLRKANPAITPDAANQPRDPRFAQ